MDETGEDGNEVQNNELMNETDTPQSPENFQDGNEVQNYEMINDTPQSPETFQDDSEFQNNEMMMMSEIDTPQSHETSEESARLEHGGQVQNHCINDTPQSPETVEDGGEAQNNNFVTDTPKSPEMVDGGEAQNDTPQSPETVEDSGDVHKAFMNDTPQSPETVGDSGEVQNDVYMNDAPQSPETEQCPHFEETRKIIQSDADPIQPHGEQDDEMVDEEEESSTEIQSEHSSDYEKYSDDGEDEDFQMDQQPPAGPEVAVNSKSGAETTILRDDKDGVDDEEPGSDKSLQNDEEPSSDKSIQNDDEPSSDKSLKKEPSLRKAVEENAEDPNSKTIDENSPPNSTENNVDFDPEEDELRRLKAQLAAVEEEDEEDEDLEEGEIEDDEELPAPVPEKVVPPASESKDKEKSSSSRHRHHSSSKDKDKDSRKFSKDKEKDKDSKSSDRRRKHSVESKDGTADKNSRADKDKSKKRIRRSEDVSLGEEDYLLVRGISMSPPPVAAGTSPGSAASGRKIYDTDPFGNPIYEDELENDFPMSPDSKRRRKSRSPQGADRRRRDESRGSRRPNSGRKDAVKPLHKSDQICAYYMQGKCQKSHEDCAFSHNAVPPRKMELCKFWMLDCCAKKEKCLYLHNDFPCKYYHTGLVCKLGLKNQCKFSHKPMNEVTKAVLLKHIETAPKEILGDFPRLNRQGALNLIAKMEDRINGELKKQERERDEERRRTRWEQPTKDDENKLQELMEEAGLGNYYQETVEGAPKRENKHHENNNHPRDRDHRKGQGQHSSHGPNSGIAPLMGLPNQLPPPMLPTQPHIVNNPALANVLASLHIPSTTIQRPPADEKENNRRNRENKGYNHRDDESLVRESRISPDSPPHQVMSGHQVHVKNEPKDEDDDNNIPDNLPPMQRGIFRRIQEQQLKNEIKIKEEVSDDEKPDDRGWYSSDDESDKPLTDVLKEIPSKAEPEKKPVVDFASVLSAIRKTTAAASNDPSEPHAKRSKLSVPSPPLASSFTGRGDVDFRIGSGGGGINQMVNDKASTSQGPFRDMDFRVPPGMRQEFKDVDLRMTDLQPAGKKSPVPVFKPLPSGPATMIDAAINSHPPRPWKVRIVAGVRAPDYNYVKHTLTPLQLSLDPRFGPRTAGGISLLPDPASPPQGSQIPMGASSPANIPGGDGIMDPRMSRRGQGVQGTGILGADPRLGGRSMERNFNPRDPRAGVQGQIPQNMMPPGWPASVDMTQAALAAQFIAAQQLGLLPFPNPGGMPMMPPNFGDMGGRPSFPSGGGRGGGPPASSWERYQQSGGVTPPT